MDEISNRFANAGYYFDFTTFTHVTVVSKKRSMKDKRREFELRNARGNIQILDEFGKDLVKQMRDSDINNVEIHDYPDTHKIFPSQTGKIGYECDDSATATIHFIRNVMGPRWKGINVRYLFVFWWTNGHAMSVVSYGGSHYIVDGSTGVILGPFKTDEEVEIAAWSAVKVGTGTDLDDWLTVGQKVEISDNLNWHEPKPFYCDPIVLGRFKDEMFRLHHDREYYKNFLPKDFE